MEKNFGAYTLLGTLSKQTLVQPQEKNSTLSPN